MTISNRMRRRPRAEVARRLDVRRLDRRHRAGDHQRHERRLLPHEGEHDAAPVEIALRGERLEQAAADQQWLSMPFLARNVRISWPAR